uniref:Uncharacterized protein n=1 Tax=Anguilla anguilla TaxID=7936 RepID=A0A0E9QIT7_ANGAN
MKSNEDSYPLFHCCESIKL